MGQTMQLTKWRTIISFKDGSEVTSDWMISDIYARQFAEQFLDDKNFDGYRFEHKVVNEDLDEILNKPPGEHPVLGFHGQMEAIDDAKGE